MRKILLLVIGLLTIVIAAYFLWQRIDLSDPRNREFLTWGTGESATRQAMVLAQRETCPGAPFILPSDGYIGLLYGDPRGPYSSASPHQGIDIFSNGPPGTSPVYAAYDGYVSREEHWRSALIQRVPDDPLQPGRQIWLYYTHMADQAGNSFIDPAIPPGTRELFVPQGTLLGYTGDYNGNSPRTIWVHLHFSIIRDDGAGRYSNELEFNNTIDPTPYLGMPLNYACEAVIIGCTANPVCPSSASPTR